MGVQDRLAMRKRFEEVAAYLEERLRQRLSKVGIPWYSEADSLEARAQFGVSPKAMGTVLVILEGTLGAPVRKVVGEFPDRVMALADLVKSAGGEITPEVEQLYREQYPDTEYIPGAVRKAAVRWASGQVPKSAARGGRGPVGAAPSPYSGDMERMCTNFRRYQKIKEEIARKEVEIEDLKRELLVYKPADDAIRIMREASAKIEEAVRTRTQ